MTGPRSAQQRACPLARSWVYRLRGPGGRKLLERQQPDVHPLHLNSAHDALDFTSKAVEDRNRWLAADNLDLTEPAEILP